ncbi:hypothetical protein L9F63_024859, partial [Diploptera punctata]
QITKWQQFGDNFISRDVMYKNDSKTYPDSELVAEFYDELKPMIYLMKSFGLFPLQREKSDDSNFKRCKITLLYSILFYMGMNVFASYELWKKIKSMGSVDTQFDELMFTVVRFMYVLPHFYMIPCHWIEVTKVGRYFTCWYEFQEHFQTVTGKPLYLGLRKRAVLSALISPVIGVMYVLSETFLVKSSQFDWEMCFYMYVMTMIMLHVTWWWLVCSALRGAISTYKLDFFKDQSMFEYESSAIKVAQYRTLWMRISRLSRDTGMFMCYSYGHLSVLAFTVTTLQLYGSLSNIHDGEYLKHTGLAVCVILSAAMIYITANCAHHATEEIGPEFNENLSCICSSKKEVRRELKMFTQVLTTNSCVINLGGYVALNRGFLLNFVSTMVTYLIVLLQFRLGILSLSPVSNSTTSSRY